MEATGLGRPRDDLAPGYRSYQVGRHLIVYRQDGEALLIVRVVHMRRDIAALFAQWEPD